MWRWWFYVACAPDSFLGSLSLMRCIVTLRLHASRLLLVRGRLTIVGQGSLMPV